MSRLRHGLLLGAFLGAAALAVEILLALPPAAEARLALRWLPVYALTGALLGAAASLLAPLTAGRQARERGPGIQMLATIGALVILAGTFLPGLILDNSFPPLAPAVLGLGAAAGVHLLGVAAAGSAAAWLAESLVSAFSAAAGLGLLLLVGGIGLLVLPGSARIEAAEIPGAAPPPLNVALVVLDGVRADHLGSLGSFRAASPRFDTLAGESVLFEQAFAADPNHPSSLERLLGGSEDPLARALTDAGWQTWALSDESRLLPGFAHQEDVGDEERRARPLLGRWLERIQARTAITAAPRPADQVVDRALALAAARDRGRPFFLVAQFMDAAPPYDPPAALRDRFLPEGLRAEDLRRAAQDQDPARLARFERGELTATAAEAQACAALYDAEILAQDAALGRLVDGLLNLGLLENTLLIVLADHGVRFGEEGGRLGHTGSLHDAVLHVPLLMRMPRLLPAGTRAAGLVSLDDLAPAILAVTSGSPDSILLAAARGGSPRRAVSAWIVEEGRTLQLLRGAHEKILLDAQGRVLAAGDLLADPDESFLRMRPPLDTDAAARWRARALELSDGSAADAGAGGSGGGVRRD